MWRKLSPKNSTSYGAEVILRRLCKKNLIVGVFVQKWRRYGYSDCTKGAGTVFIFSAMLCLAYIFKIFCAIYASACTCLNAKMLTVFRFTQDYSYWLCSAITTTAGEGKLHSLFEYLWVDHIWRNVLSMNQVRWTNWIYYYSWLKGRKHSQLSRWQLGNVSILKRNCYEK